MAHILNQDDISQLQKIFLGSNLLSNNQYQEGVWCYQTKRAYEGWCVAHGILTIAAKIQPHSLEALPLPLQETMRKYLEAKGAVKETGKAVPAKPEVKLPPAVEPPVIEPEPIVEPVVETPVVEAEEEPFVEDPEVDEDDSATANPEVTPEKRNLNHFKNRHNNGK